MGTMSSGGHSGLLRNTTAMATLICHSKMVATPPRKGWPGRPLGEWVGGCREADRPILVLEAGAEEPCSFQTTDASSFQTLSPPSAVSPAPLWAPTSYPTPIARGLLLPKAWLAEGTGNGGPREALLFSCLVLCDLLPASLISSALCNQVSPSQLLASFSWLPDLT